MLTSIASPLAAFLAVLSLLPLGGCAPEAAEPVYAEIKPDEIVETVPPPPAYGEPLPESEAVTDDWFSNTAFIGHSLVQGLAGYGGLYTADYYYLGGSSTQSLLSSGSVSLPGGATGYLRTGLNGRSYERVYLMMGINEVGGRRDDLKASYLDLLNTVRTYNPSAEIYVLAVAPVTQNRDAGGTFTIARILAYNEMLRELCAEEECWYVDLYDCFADQWGYLPASASTDGIHLRQEQYAVMLSYIRTHTAPL